MWTIDKCAKSNMATELGKVVQVTKVHPSSTQEVVVLSLLAVGGGQKTIYTD